MMSFYGFWECQLKPAVRERTLREMESLINRTYLDRFRLKKPVTYKNPEESPDSIAAEPTEPYGQ